MYIGQPVHSELAIFLIIYFRIKEDVFDEEDEDTEFNRLIKILMVCREF